MNRRPPRVKPLVEVLDVCAPWCPNMSSVEGVKVTKEQASQLASAAINERNKDCVFVQSGVCQLPDRLKEALINGLE
jgi:hypothetical protein